MKLLKHYSLALSLFLGMAAALPAQALDLKLATLAPDGTTWMLEMRKGAEEINRRTEGRVNIKFYPGGSMGSDRIVLRKIRAGQLHGGALTGGALGDIHHDLQIYSLPFLFRSIDELDYVRARMDKALAQSLEKNGFVTFGFSDGGFAYMMSSNPLRKVDDLKAQKVWIPEGDDISRALFENLGISPVPLPLTDVLTGLQTGLITTTASPAIGAITLQWHTRVKYLTDAPTSYIFGALAIDKKAFSKISPSDQGVVRSVMEKIFVEFNRQNRLDEQSARQALKKQGIEFIVLPPEELAKLDRAAHDANERLGQKNVYNLATLRTVQGHLETYRRKPGTAR